MSDAHESSPHFIRRLSADHPRLVSLLIFIAMSVAFVLMFQRSLAAPFERDEGEYAWAAHLLLSGGVPYRDTFLQKPPGIVLVYATIFRTIGRDIAAVHTGLMIAHLLS